MFSNSAKPFIIAEIGMNHNCQLDLAENQLKQPQQVLQR